MNDRPTASTITDPQLDELHDQLDNAYRERAHLLAWLAALHPAVIAPAPDTDEPDWQILYLHSSAHGWQMTWHIHPRDAELFTDVEHVPADDPRAQWDGHTTDAKYRRIRIHTHVVHLNSRLGAASCPVCEGSGRCPSCRTTMRARPEDERVEELAAALREVLAAFSTTVRGPDKQTLGHYAEHPVAPEDMARWRAVLNQPKEQQP